MPQPTTLATTIAAGGTGHVQATQTVHAAINNLTIIPSSNKTVNYTFGLTDSGEVVESNASTALTFFVPANSTVAFPIGTVLSVCRYGSGSLTIAASTGVVIRASDVLTLRTQYSEATLRKRATDEWVLSGDLG